MGQNLKCDGCGSSLKRRLSRVNDKNYCSNRCHGDSTRARSTIACDGCGMEIHRIASQVHYKNFCSRSCYGRWRSENRFGSDAPNYRGGPKINEDYGNRWAEVRKKTYERDGWTCRVCNVKCHGNRGNNKIQCHHIDYNIENHDERSLITLCVACHCRTNYDRTYWIDKFVEIVEGERGS